MTTVVAVLLGGLVGAPLRYHLDRLVQRRHGGTFPWGTFVVNVVGCAVLGLLVSGPASLSQGPVFDLLGVGLCGAFTTYSTFGYETVRLLEDGGRLPAVANVALNVVTGLAAAFVGGLLGSLLVGG